MLIYLSYMKHYNIPIFIPQLACKNQCIYCNQRHISGQITIPSKEEIINKIELHLKTFQKPYHAELAFFGGSFTAIGLEKQRYYLEIIQPYIESNQIESIRISTRPDCIRQETLDLLKRYNVKTIELGAQSLSQEVLDYSQRGHTVEDIEDASRLINQNGFNLGLQMMIGLPKDTIEKSIHTANQIVSLGAKCTRIYPTLVIDNTELAEQYRQKEYKPLQLEEAIDWTSKIYQIFYENKINILRVGLHPSEALISHKELLSGAFHVSFRQLVLTKIWHKKLQPLLSQTSNQLTLFVHPQSLNSAIGYNSTNRNQLKRHHKHILFKPDSSLREFQYKYEII